MARHATYLLDGERVSPPAGWQRQNGWAMADCVKRCIHCGEPLWRSPSVRTKSEWKTRMVHKQCAPKHSGKIQKGKQNMRAQLKDVDPPPIKRPNAASLDAEQARINLAVDRAYGERMDTPLSMVAGIIPHIGWLFA